MLSDFSTTIFESNALDKQKHTQINRANSRSKQNGQTNRNRQPHAARTRPGGRLQLRKWHSDMGVHRQKPCNPASSSLKNRNQGHKDRSTHCNWFIFLCIVTWSLRLSRLIEIRTDTKEHLSVVRFVASLFFFFLSLGAYKARFLRKHIRKRAYGVYIKHNGV